MTRIFKLTCVALLFLVTCIGLPTFLFILILPSGTPAIVYPGGYGISMLTCLYLLLIKRDSYLRFLFGRGIDWAYAPPKPNARIRIHHE